MTSKEAIAKLNVLSSYETSKEKREEYKECIHAILKDLEILDLLKQLLKSAKVFKENEIDISKCVVILSESTDEMIKEWLENEKTN